MCFLNLQGTFLFAPPKEKCQEKVWSRLHFVPPCPEKAIGIRHRTRLRQDKSGTRERAATAKGFPLFPKSNYKSLAVIRSFIQRPAVSASPATAVRAANTNCWNQTFRSCFSEHFLLLPESQLCSLYPCRNLTLLP